MGLFEGSASMKNCPGALGAVVVALTPSDRQPIFGKVGRPMKPLASSGVDAKYSFAAADRRSTSFFLYRLFLGVQRQSGDDHVHPTHGSKLSRGGPRLGSPGKRMREWHAIIPASRATFRYGRHLRSACLDRRGEAEVASRSFERSGGGAKSRSPR
jgi:hypothetical protein